MSGAFAECSTRARTQSRVRRGVRRDSPRLVGGVRDVKLYFDKENGLLVKREHRLLDSVTGKEVLQEVVFGDYKETEGLNHYRTLTAYRDGKKMVEAKVVELEFFDKRDKNVFTKP